MSMTAVRQPGAIRVIDGGTLSCSHWITARHQVGLQTTLLISAHHSAYIVNLAAAASLPKQSDDGDGIIVNITTPTSQQQLVKSIEGTSGEAKCESLRMFSCFKTNPFFASFSSGENCRGPFQAIKSRFYKLESSFQPQHAGCRW